MPGAGCQSPDSGEADYITSGLPAILHLAVNKKRWSIIDHLPFSQYDINAQILSTISIHKLLFRRDFADVLHLASAIVSIQLFDVFHAVGDERAVGNDLVMLGLGSI